MTKKVSNKVTATKSNNNNNNDNNSNNNSSSSNNNSSSSNNKNGNKKSKAKKSPTRSQSNTTANNNDNTNTNTNTNNINDNDNNDDENNTTTNIDDNNDNTTTNNNTVNNTANANSNDDINDNKNNDHNNNDDNNDNKNSSSSSNNNNDNNDDNNNHLEPKIHVIGVDLSGASFTPFIKHILNTPLSAEALTAAARALLNALEELPKVLRSSYRLEVYPSHSQPQSQQQQQQQQQQQPQQPQQQQPQQQQQQQPQQSQWVMLIRIDIIAYFHRVTNKQPAFFSQLKQYLHLHLNTPCPDLFDDPTPVQIDCPKEQCKYMFLENPACHHRYNPEHLNKYDHSKRCTVRLKRRDTLHTKPCEHWFSQKLVIVPLSFGQFTVLVRREGTREMLVVPPLSNPDLHDNTQLATSTAFWSHVLLVSNLIATEALSNIIQHPIEQYHLNFGQWETAASNDDGATYCHGHAHIVLTREAALHWSNTVSESSKYRLFVGHVRTPTDEHSKDCERVFQLNLMNQVSVVEADVAEIKQDMKRIFAILQELKASLV